jgi:hypothetical protein
MKRFVVGNSVVLFLVAAGTGHGADGQQPLHKATLSAEYAKVRDLVLPSASEKSYRKINWRNSVLRGIVDAQANDKPVMLVLMNGHPLGCT